MKKIGLILIGVLLLLGAAYGVFTWLEGNTSITIQVVDAAPDRLVGKSFRGIPQDKKLEETFQSLETFRSLHPGTYLHTIYYQEPAGKLDTMEVFVGINLPYATQGMESKSFGESRYLRAIIQGNKWVMPNPERIKEKIRSFASQEGFTLSEVFVEKIITESEVQVIAPVK
ncbi:MAG: hypothetical protein EB038_10600 [Cyclobacteriaceae bacterium]|jgi:hypothetical protein|nr:hypothetical protein [Cyclobacteriaceae bacterium]